jgi:aldose 1-epimerase
MRPLVKLNIGTAECSLCPDAGGSIVSWSIDGQDLLRRADGAAIASGDPLRFASFPLVPFSNRIANGNFQWDGEQIEIDRNFAPEIHAIHGVGWKMPWEISDQSATRCVLSLCHKADSRWHWPFSATQTVVLTEQTMEITLEAVNLSDEPRPLAFGHHPYFDQHNAFLAFNAEQVFMSDSDGLPSHPETPFGAFDFSKGEQVEGRDIDHCYSGWPGEARIIWQDRPLGLVITSTMSAAVVYIPKYGDAFCFEPVPHINNALNRPNDEPAMPIIHPGGSYRSMIKMAAMAAELI